MTAVGAPARDDAAALEGGFADPAREAARAFRALLDAMARPGTIHAVRGAAPPAPLPPAAGALLLTLADAETPLWLAPDLATDATRAWIRFHCGAPLVEARGAAALAVGSPAALAPADDWAAGGMDRPDRSATLVALIAGFDGAAATLTGPGIDGAATLPLGGDLAAVRALADANRGAFPLGRDLFLAAGDRVAALPRTTRMEG